MNGITKIQMHLKSYLEGPTAKKIGSLCGRGVEIARSGLQNITQVALSALKASKEGLNKSKNSLKEHVFKPIQECASKAIKALSSRIASFREKHCPCRYFKRA